jgi:hypothetical protein
MNDFPAGWQISRGVANARFCWQRGYRGNYSVAIANCLNDEYSSICQSSACYIPVCEGEEWRVGAVLQVNQGMGASILYLIPGLKIVSGYDIKMYPVIFPDRKLKSILP